MCRVLQAVIRRYKHAPHSEQDLYNRRSLVEDIEAEESFQEDQSSMFSDDMHQEGKDYCILVTHTYMYVINGRYLLCAL